MCAGGLDTTAAELNVRGPAAESSSPQEAPRSRISEINADDVDVSFFQQPWWLDAMSEGNYRTVTAGDGANTFFWLPYVETKVFGMRVFDMPPLTHTLGPVIRLPDGKAATTTATRRKLIDAGLEQLEAHDGFTQVLDPSFTDAQDYSLNGLEVSLRYTYRIDTSAGEDAVWDELLNKARTKVRRAGKRLLVEDDLDAKAFFEFYDANLGRRGRINDHSAAEQQRVIEALDGRGRHCVMWARDRLTGRPAAAMLLVWDQRALYYFRITRNIEMDGLDAPSLLLWAAIKKACSLGLAFDSDSFLGRGGAIFLEDFGGQRCQRLVVSRKSLALKALEAAQRRLPALSRFHTQPRKAEGAVWSPGQALPASHIA